ncbi:MAG: DUF3192 domain-containing protein [Candidatus Omnitrophica bacterium]|nr:DUF3192 domain-containing protein [Candidatus Omnitrophota bacterium]
MKKILKACFVALLCLCLLGCGTLWCDSMKSVRAHNKENLQKLKPGMSIHEVLEIMGTESRGSSFPLVEEVGETITDIGFSFLTSSQAVRNPYKTKVLQEGRTTTEVFYYYTDMKNRDGKITDSELTPVVFRNGVLVGWGKDFLKKHLRETGFFAE